jgi:osmoprotectant transport system permease protein
MSILKRTVEHLDLVRRSLIPAILLGIPFGIIAYRFRIAGQVLLGVVGIFQTIPALALLVLVMPLVAILGARSIGEGSLSAVIALFLYSLLPIVRNTYAGFQGIENQYKESAQALGLSKRYTLFHIEMPLAMRSILAGIKTAAVMNVGFAALGGLIGAGGYGQPIMTGIRLDSMSLILQGAIPAALMAVVVQLLFELVERWVVPKGLRLRPAD